MDDIIDGAEPSEPVATPEIEQAQAEPTPRDAIDRAFASLDAKDSGQEGTKPDSPQLSVDTEGQKRGPDGKFLAKEPDAEQQPAVKPQEGDDANKKPAEPETKTQFAEPPSRFSAEAKEAWKTAPEPVKAEVHRALTEMEAGIEKHRAGAQEWENLREFSELARQNNVTVKDAMARYVAADRHLNQDLIGGLDALAKQYGSSLHDIAAHVLNQPADQVQSQGAAEIRALNEKIARLEHSLNGVTTNIQSQNQTATLREVEAFAKANPRFDELSQAIAAEIQHGHDLQTAYRRAELLNPLPAPAVVAKPAPDLSAQTRKGTLSVSGAPSSGSNPANRKPPSSARDALDRAFASTGIG